MNPLRPCADMPVERLFEYSSRMLDAPEARRIEAHLKLCSRCRAAIAGFKALDNLLEEWKPVEPSPWFDTRTRAHIAASIAAHQDSWFLTAGWKRWVVVAAVILLAVGTSVIAFHRASRTGGERQPEVAVESQPQTVHEQPAAPPPSALALNEETGKAPQAGPAESAVQEMNLYKHLNVLENYDMLAHFDVLSELPQAGDKASD